MSHLPPFFCPYCGDEELRPYGERHGEWLCGSCRRAFALRAVKQGSSQESVGAGATTGEVAR